ncbi:hypothetical protein RDWZM_005811 [Blomia tropicalis]|uniref:DNA primase large subunit n=1 Tax=Blomia tropicalis TaxID=40697 RepID=A0A9Q0RMP9_BLOTA|nr:hypothetical protein RDWZM_005811 [Blomia tropicalis]
MQFERRKRIRLNDSTENTNPYPFWINFYTTPPTYKVSLEEINDLCSERLKMLQVIDNLLKIDNTKRSKEFYDIMLSQLSNIKTSKNEKNFFLAGRSELTSKVFEARKNDHISHFLLRIFYCQTPELRKWFIARETDLFRYRVLETCLNNSSILKDCLKFYDYKYELVPMEEQTNMQKFIYWNSVNRNGNANEIAFKLKFEEAIDLVRNRKVFLNNGFAYVSASEMLTVLCNEFRTNLSRELSQMYSDFNSLNEERLIKQLETLHNQFFSNSRKNNNMNSDQNDRNRIYPNEINDLAKEVFPPCMRSIHDTLRRDHHLKHYGRLHYGLFLKSAGLKMEDSIEFFRSEMSIHNPEKFQKEYSYAIRYIYGREGKRVQLSAYSCQKIINGCAPGPSDTHGCPFKHFDTKHLKAMLVRYGISDEEQISEIVQLVTKEGNATGACAKYFSIKHRVTEDFSTIYHPNQFLTEARKVLLTPAPTIIKQENDRSTTEENDTSLSGLNETTMDSIKSISDILNDDDLHEMESIEV